MMSPTEHREAMNRIAAWASILADTDAIVVLMKLAERLVAGHQEYGALDLDADLRDWKAERAAEALDRAIYTAFDDLTAVRRRQSS